MEETTILVVDDEEKIRQVIVSYLERAGYHAVEAKSGSEALEQYKKTNPALIVLDLLLPDLSGEKVCERIRETGNTPVIMLTAKVGEAEKLTGFQSGADDYVTKPFSPKELLARIEAVLRRAAPKEIPVEEWKGFNKGTLRVNSLRHEVTVDECKVNLTPNEFKLLITLSSYPGKVFTREELITLVLGKGYEGYDRTIDTYVKTVRKKIEKIPSKPDFIQTVHGIGYKFSGAADDNKS